MRAPAGRRRGRGHGGGRAAGRLGGPHGARLAVRTARPVTATFALRERTAVVELATAAGIGLLAHPAPMTASTRGVGELVLAALDAVVDRIVLGIGGSATTDGGAGMLQALGARLRRRERRRCPAGWGRAGSAGADRGRRPGSAAGRRRDRRGLRRGQPADRPGRRGGDVRPAEGGDGRSRSPCSTRRSPASPPSWRGTLGLDVTVLRGGGGAGGTAAGAVAVLGARIVSGAGLVCDLVGLDAVLRTPTWRSPGRGRWTGRPCAARPRTRWPLALRPPAFRASRWRAGAAGRSRRGRSRFRRRPRDDRGGAGPRALPDGAGRGAGRAGCAGSGGASLIGRTRADAVVPHGMTRDTRSFLGGSSPLSGAMPHGHPPVMTRHPEPLHLCTAREGDSAPGIGTSLHSKGSTPWSAMPRSRSPPCSPAPPRRRRRLAGQRRAAAPDPGRPRERRRR